MKGLFLSQHSTAAFHNMKLLLCLLSSFLFADESTDCLVIEKVLKSLNDPRTTSDPKLLSSLFISKADRAELDQLSKLQAFNSSQSMSEVSRPILTPNFIRFLTPDIALVDATSTQFGTQIIMRKIPLLLIFVRQAAEWRIASIRVLGGMSGPGYLGIGEPVLLEPLGNPPIRSQGIQKTQLHP